jgi:hypothetical protein
MLHAILESYSVGIKENIKKGIDHLLVPEDIFSVGKSIVISLVEFIQIQATEEEDQLLIDNDLTPKKLRGQLIHYNWALIAEFLKLFKFDP